MAVLISPAGTKVSVEGDLAARLRGMGWTAPVPTVKAAPRTKAAKAE